MRTTLDAGTLRDAMASYLEALRDHREEIDSLNVFPVPDGDTGRNMMMTQQAVVDALRGLEGAGVAAVGEAISRSALMGARGNSGVILSQVLRGLCRRLCGQEEATAEDLATALEEASDASRGAVASPVEGTMLSVLADGARAARQACRDGGDAGTVAAAALRGAEGALARTPEQLPALAEAGVVDAGGKGIVLLLDAIRSAVSGSPLSVGVGPLGPIGEEAAPPEGEPQSHGYEVMYLLECPDDAVAGLRAGLDGLGDSVVVVGGGGLYNVHVHTDDPGGAIERGIGTGRPREARVASLDRQIADACLADQARAVRIGEPQGTPQKPCALVAVASGEGAAELFRSLGAGVVPGGPSANPSVRGIAEAITAAGSSSVVVLPNHPDVIPAAEEAAGQVAMRVTVIPTTSVQEGLAAATAFNPEAALDENAARGRQAAAAMISVEVETAARDADTAAGPVRRGDVLGLTGGEIRAVGADPVEVAVRVLRPLVSTEHEVLTVLTGDGMVRAEADRVATALADAFPGLHVDVHHGGQPMHLLSIGLE